MLFICRAEDKREKKKNYNKKILFWCCSAAVLQKKKLHGIKDKEMLTLPLLIFPI
jgi:hypothetical protein